MTVKKPPEKLGMINRAFMLEERAKVDEEARTVELSFSSELPYQRYWGTEILDHNPKSIRLGRLNGGGAVLVNHDINQQVGVVEKAEVGSDRKARALLRFSRSKAADEVFQDVKDGIRKLVSVGYAIHRMKLEEEGDDGGTYRVTDWEPFEVSLVAVPADPSVGVGRSDDEQRPVVIETPIVEIKKMTEEAKPQEKPVDVVAVRNAAAEAERTRVREILAYGEKFNQRDMAQKAVNDGTELEQFRVALLESQGKIKPVDHDAAKLGMSEKEVKRYSLMRVMNALANPGDKRIQDAAAYEREVSSAYAEKLGKQARGMLVPFDVLTRDLSVGTTTAGGHTVATELLAGSFIDLLRNRLAIAQVGATMLDGLVGNIAIPRQTSGATAYWVAEAGSPTESQQAFDQVTMTPKTVGAFTDYSRKLLNQSSISVEQFVKNDLAKVLALEIDRAAIHGSGSSNQPTGIVATSGIGSVAGGTNGLAPTWAHIVSLETEVAQDNADIGTLAYLTNSKVRGKLKTTEKSSSTGLYVWGEDGRLNGYKAAVSNQVSSTLTKGTSSGVCSAIIFGNFSDLLMGFWGGLDLMVDPYTSSTSGTVRIVALQDMDIAVRHAESFAAMLDALTT